MASIEEINRYLLQRGPTAKRSPINHLVRAENGCWLWTGRPNGIGGYGAINRDGKQTAVHRHIYETFVGPIPPGYVVDHTCHNTDPSCPGGFECHHRLCCNPSHLEAVTASENCKRGRNGNRA